MRHRLAVTDVSVYLICYIFKNLDCPETSVSKYQPTLLNIPEEESLVYTAAEADILRQALLTDGFSQFSGLLTLCGQPR